MSQLDMNQLLARLLDQVADMGAEADVIANQEKAFSLKADKGELSEYKVTSSQQIGIRLIKEGRVGIAYSESLDQSALAAMLHAPGFVLLLPIAFILGASMSLFDVSINADGTELEHVGGKPIMSNLHGMFSAGGMAGAALVAFLLHLGMPPAQQLALISGVLAVVIGVASRGMLVTHSTSDEPKQNFAWPRGLLLVIGLLILAGMIAEGVMYDWCVLYLKQELGKGWSLRTGIGKVRALNEGLNSTVYDISLGYSFGLPVH
mgnify:CR=1 FL=1